MICLLGILFVVTGTLAQPPEGPWEVLETDSGWTLGQVRVISNSQDTVGVFYGEENADGDVRARYATYLLASHELLAVPATLSYTAEWRATYDDAMPLGDGTWVCTIYKETGSTYGEGENEALLIHGSPLVPGGIPFVLHHGGTDPIGWCWGDCSAMTGCHLARRSGGGILVGASAFIYFDIGGGAREIDSYLSLWAFGSSYSVPDWTVTPWPPAWIGYSYHWPLSLNADSALVVSTGSWGNFLLHACADSPETVGIDSFECGMTYITYAMRTSGGRTLLFGTSAYYEFLALSDSGECERLSVWQPDHFLSVLTSHPGYGFAGLFAQPSSLQIARVDTNGQEVQPVGTFFWRDDEHVIVEGNLTIADDSRVIVLWSERDVGSPDATRLRIGSVGWSTPLTVKDSDFIPHPSSFIVSAYPNPFNSELTIRYELSRAADVELKMFNLLGEEIAVLKSGRETAGAHAVTWRPDVGSGIYFVRMKVGEVAEMRKIVYLK